MDYTKIETIKQKLKNILDEKRYAHTLRTVNMAMELCMGTNADKEKVFLAALLHDCAKPYASIDEYNPLVPNKKIWEEELKEYMPFPKILHGPLGVLVARCEYGINDETVLNAIKYHSTGRPGMSIEEKIVFLADAIEDGREYPNVENIRRKTRISIDQGILESLRGIEKCEKEIHHLTHETIEYLEKKNG